ncbi:carboxypeptidase-like regulatory domain-containing protein, partial [Gemmatimonas sp.]
MNRVIKSACRGLAGLALAVSAAAAVTPTAAHAQVTGSAIRGTVRDSSGRGVENVRVEAIHQPSGTRYAAVTRGNGGYSLIGLRVGGPYTISTSALGFAKQTASDVFLTLGITYDQSFTLRVAAVQLAGVVTTAE